MPACRRTRRAEEDLIELWLHIAAHDVRAADKLLDRLELAFTLLADRPHLGPARPDLAADLRYHIVANYLILYRVVPVGV